MKPYEIMRFFHQKLDRFVYKQRGSVIVVDIIFQPMRSINCHFSFEESSETLKQKSIRIRYKAKKAAQKSGDL